MKAKFDFFYLLIAYPFSLANAGASFWNAYHEHFDRGAYYMAFAILLWLMAQDSYAKWLRANEA